MAENPLTLTQTSEQSPSIFVDASGSPLLIYLDVNPDILSRPRLIRLLRTSGADICHNPSDASILLINSETESGCKVVHDWCEDTDKTVLKYGWIQACIRAGRPLLEADEWGGFHVPHTSECIYSEDEGDEDMEDGHSGSRNKASLNPTRPRPAQPSSTEPSVKLNTSSPPPPRPAVINRELCLLGILRPDPTNLFHALNPASLLQQNATAQTLARLVETVIAVAQGQGIDTAIIQNYLATLPMSSSLIQPSPPPHVPDLTSHRLEESPGSSVSGPSPEDVGLSYEPSLPAKRRRTSPKPPPQAKKATSSPRQKPSRVAHEPPQPTRSIFSMKNGQPILVFVQIDTRGRHGIVHLIKKNGGQITADIPRATFVILNPRSVSYADLRQEAEDSEKMIVRIAFITDSIEQGHLVDPNDYLLEDASSPRKRKGGGRRSTSFRDTGRRSPENNHEPSETQTSDTVVDAPSSIPSRGRSTTPEPPAAVQSKGGYKYTPAEMTYSWALIRRIITKDRQANKVTVIKALHKKMPHHSPASWSSMLTRQKEMYEAIREEALRSTPTSEAHSPNAQQLQDVHLSLGEPSDAEMDEAYQEAEVLEVLQVRASLIPAEEEPMHDDEHQQSSLEDVDKDENKLDAYARDFEALVEFLASADADGGGEDEIFERLAAKVNACMTAPSWPDFLEQHAAAVAEEVERRYTTQQVT
ncbi:hypothetical protein BJV78DRAFT_1277914 [Lactifluus subvellereus]|nr:hypothetical protein BJV78DRAFT_1277914 [Lactifluus subvellereus]